FAAKLFASLYGETQLDTNVIPQVALVMRWLRQLPVKSGRRNFEHVMPRYRILDVQQRADLTADGLAILEPHAFRLVDEHPNDAVPTREPQLEIGQFITQPFNGGFQ